MPRSNRPAAAAATTLCALVFAMASPVPADPGIDFGTNAPTKADDAAIRGLLDAYTSAVDTSDEARFEALLLNDHIPFTGVGRTVTDAPGKPYDDENFADFDRSIFKSGTPLEQTFHNVMIAQDGPLGQVSLDFITKEAKTGQGVWGWKILQLVKLDGVWKIASEFYTVHPLPKS